MAKRTFSADQIMPFFKTDPKGWKTPFARYTFYEDKRWDGKEMLMIEISEDDAPVTSKDGDQNGCVMPKELLE